MENNLLQKNTATMMNKAFERSARSFSEFINSPVSCGNGRIHIEKIKENLFGRSMPESLMVLTTDMIGELSGRSYMILNDADREKFGKLIPLQAPAAVELQEAFLMEIDNIISAAVISQLADELDVEVFGDVPQVQYTKPAILEEILNASIHDCSSGAVFCTTTFFLTSLQIELQFIWKLNSKVMDLVNNSLSCKS